MTFSLLLSPFSKFAMHTLALTFLDALAILGGVLVVGILLLVVWILETHASVGRQIDQDRNGGAE